MHKPIETTPELPEGLFDDLQRAMRTMRHIKHPARMTAGELTPSERHLIQCIASASERNPSVRPADLSESSHFSPSAISPMLKSLEEKGFIVRRTGEHDRRVVYIELTPEGAELTKRVSLAIDTQLRGLVTQLGVEDTAAFISLIDRVAAYFETAAGGESDAETPHRA